MHQQKKYKNMVFYIEACFSGSMFIRRLPKDIGVFAMTAANDKESSWSIFFDHKRRTSLADEFSIRWMKDTENNDVNTYTIAQQFENVKKQVRNSHVSAFGDENGMGGMTIGEFQGSSRSSYNSSGVVVEEVGLRVPTWDVPYTALLLELQETTTTEGRLRILNKMIQEEKMKQNIQQTLVAISSHIVRKPLIMFRPKSLEPTLAEDLCYEHSVVKFEQSCYHLEEYSYAMKDLHVFANLCSHGATVEKIQQAIDNVCPATQTVLVE
jgi:legumain